MSITKGHVIGQIVTNDYRTAKVFQKYGIDFYCDGNRTVEDACIKKAINPSEIIQSLDKVQTDGTQEDEYHQWSLDVLVDYIVNNHHQFICNKLPDICEDAMKVTEEYGELHEELNVIYYELTMLHTEIFNHIEKEERLLFPYIKRLVEAEKNGNQPEARPFEEVEQAISMLEEEHDEGGILMAKIRKLSNDFTPPDDASKNYRVLYQNMEDFEKDLQKHLHLENNILFPNAVKLENKLTN